MSNFCDCNQGRLPCSCDKAWATSTLQRHELEATRARLNCYRLLALSGWLLLLFAIGGNV
jgi:hypothetical protein